MATELEPTAGPWATDYRKVPGGYAQEVFDSNGKTIATCAWYPVQVSDTTTATNRAANARLIAAAPELLALCERAAVHVRPTCSDLYDELMAVIVKATGMAANK